MRFRSQLLTLVLIAMIHTPVELHARGRGGGGFSGGGASRAGGFSGGGAAFSNSPSMSRAAPVSRPSTSVPRSSFSQASSPAISRPAGSSTLNRTSTAQSLNRPSAASSAGMRQPAAGTASLQSRQSFQQPTRGQLDSFLSGGSVSTSTSTSSRVAGGPTAGQGGQSRTYETSRGGTITVGGGSRSGTTEGGTNVGGAAGGIKVETAGGNTLVRGTGAVGATDGQNSAFAAGSRTGVETAAGGQAVAGSGVRGVSDGTNTAVRAGGAVGARDAAGNTAVAGRGATGVTDGTNSAVRGGGFAGAQDAAGNTAVNVRGGYADSSGYRQGASVTARQNQWGYTAVNVRAGYGAGGTGQVASKTAVRGPAGNVISGGRGATFVNGQFVGGQAYTAVNGAFTNWGYFTPNYYARYPGAWFPGKWALVGTAWAATTWPVASSYCGCEGSGTYYDYEENVAFEDGMVSYEGETIATEEEYYQQTETIADAGTETQDEEWLPLGVFAIISEADQTNTDKVIQLAINREGVVRGNYQDMLTEQVIPVSGSVDKESKRVALKFENNDSLIVEIGMYNLTNDEVPALVHFDASRREPRTLIRLHNPEENS